MGAGIVHEWLTQLAQSESPPDTILAFNIGMFETEQGFSVYITGSHSYDADGDWACDEDYSPNQKYLELSRDYLNGMPWEDVLSKVISDVKAFLASEAAQGSFLSPPKIVTVGFDDGDLIPLQ